MVKKIKQAIIEQSGEQDFKYLGSWINSEERDICKAWQSLNNEEYLEK